MHSRLYVGESSLSDCACSLLSDASSFMLCLLCQTAHAVLCQSRRSLDLPVLSGFPFMGGDDVSTTSLTFINYLHRDQDGPESTRHLENVLASL
jgi:hypothetical protein